MEAELFPSFPNELKHKATTCWNERFILRIISADYAQNTLKSKSVSIQTIGSSNNWLIDKAILIFILFSFYKSEK